MDRGLKEKARSYIKPKSNLLTKGITSVFKIATTERNIKTYIKYPYIDGNKQLYDMYNYIGINQDRVYWDYELAIVHLNDSICNVVHKTKSETIAIENEIIYDQSRYIYTYNIDKTILKWESNKHRQMEYIIHETGIKYDSSQSMINYIINQFRLTFMEHKIEFLKHNTDLIIHKIEV